MQRREIFKLPENFTIERELAEQLSSRPGSQRCIVGERELLLVVHEVPRPGVPERQPHVFWKHDETMWEQAGAHGLSELAELLTRYEAAIDEHEAEIDEADTAEEIFHIIRHAAPLARSTRNLATALDQVLAVDHDDHEILSLRDRAKEIERAAELLNHDARLTLELWRAEHDEELAEASMHLSRTAFRLNLLAGFFLPVMALASIFGMNVKLPGSPGYMFWPIILGGLAIGMGILFLVGQKKWDAKELARTWLEKWHSRNG